MFSKIGYRRYFLNLFIQTQDTNHREGEVLADLLRRALFGQNPFDEEDDEDKDLAFISRWEGKEWLLREWQEISSILRSRHYQIWQARTVWLASIAAFIGLTASKVLDIALSSMFITSLSAFMILLDYKYQRIKQRLYARAIKLEKHLCFNIYGKIRDDVDKPIYATLLWIVLLLAILIWFVVGCIY